MADTNDLLTETIVLVVCILTMLCMARCCFARLFWHSICRVCFINPLKRTVPKALRMEKASTETVCFEDFQTMIGCCYLFSPIICDVDRKSIPIYDAIHRYNEQGNDPPTLEKLFKEISEDEFISLMLQEISATNPNLFLRVLPTGSLRERSGKSLPSTSILASDYDLMLIPDAIEAGIPGIHQERATFEIVEIENEPGYVWLKLKKPDLGTWKELCYQRLMPNQSVELFLSQLAVYNKIKNTLSLSQDIEKFIANNLLHKYPNECCQCCCDCISDRMCPQYNVQEFLFERSGPALTMILKPKYGDAYTHVDFTFGMFCKEFPASCKDFFTRRERNVSDEEDDGNRNCVYWPDEETVERIKRSGCHVVPKPASKSLVVITSQQAENPYLSNNAVFEWRMSFSMGEAILSEVLPEIAREAYLAFKAVVKIHVNQIVDELGDFHKVESYFLKTILLRLVESTNTLFWDVETDLETSISETDSSNESSSPGSEVSDTTSELMEENTVIDLDDYDESDVLLNERDCDRDRTDSLNNSTNDSYEEIKDPLEERRKQRTVAFFDKLFDSLQKCCEDKNLPHYWNPKIDLFAKYTDLDFEFILHQIKRIRLNYKACLIDNWVELQRVMASSVWCSCCLPVKKPAKFISLREPVHLSCCRFKMKGIDIEADNQRWDVNPAKVYVY